MSCLKSVSYHLPTLLVFSGHKQAKILASEAYKAEQINRAAGEAEAIFARAQAAAKSLQTVATSFEHNKAADAAGLAVAEKYVEAFAQIAQKGNTILLPAHLSEPASMVAGVLQTWKQLQKNNTTDDLVTSTKRV
jgi:regulator of protease activity HflC (stomatin/prohibitin superfamily)